jgi:hypothetical protein
MLAFLYHEVIIDVSEFLVNDLNLKSPITITAIGGTGNDIFGRKVTFENTVNFRVGEEVIVFAEEREIAWRGRKQVKRLMVTGYFQGKFELTNDGRAINELPERTTTLSEILGSVKAKRRR